AEAAGNRIVDGVLQHVDHGLGLKASGVEIDLVFRVEFKRAALGFSRCINAERLQSLKKLRDDVRLLRAETALTLAQPGGDIRDKVLYERRVLAIEDTDMVAAFELNK